MALEAKNINNASDMKNYVEGCLNDLVEGLSTVEETMVYMKEYTHRVIDLASASQKPETSESALPKQVKAADSVGVLTNQKLIEMAKMITSRQKRAKEYPTDKVDWNVLEEMWFDWLREELGLD